MNLRRLGWATVAAVLMSGCASMGAGVSAVGSKPWLTMNGKILSRTDGDAYTLGQLTGMPVPKSQSDAVAMGKLTMVYATTAKSALARGDVETFVAARYLAGKAASMQAAVYASSKMAVATMTQGSMRQMLVPAGGVVLLPAFDRFRNIERSAMARPASYWYMTADASNDALSLAKQLLSAATVIQGVLTDKPKSALMGLPEGVPYTLRTATGKTVVVERAKDMLVVHNPGGEPVEVDVEKLGFIPRLMPPDSLRKEAAPILMQMAAVTDAAFKECRSCKRVYMKAPNRVEGYKPISVDEQGAVASNNTAVTRGELAYSKSKAYRLAVKSLDEGIFSTPERIEFDRLCFSSDRERLGTNTMVRYLGQYAEVQELLCRDSSFSTVYSKSYHVTAAGKVQTWDSVLKDRQSRKAVENALDEINAAAAVASVVPLWGNMDSASVCSGDATFTEQLYRSKRASADVVKLAKMVGLSRDLSFKDWALNCGMAINIFAAPMKGVKVLAELGKLSPAKVALLEATEKKMALVNTAILNRKKWADVESLLPSGNAAILVKIAYDAAQQQSQVSQLIDAVQSMK